MRSDTQTVMIEAGSAQVFAFLANPENLPRWAVGFCRTIRHDGDTWIAETGHGGVGVRFVTDDEHGVIDYHMTPAPGMEAVAVSRVVPNGDHAQYIFTQFQAPGMPDEMFEGQRAALKEELEVLRILFRAQAACESGR